MKAVLSFVAIALLVGCSVYDEPAQADPGEEEEVIGHRGGSVIRAGDRPAAPTTASITGGSNDAPAQPAAASAPSATPTTPAAPSGTPSETPTAPADAPAAPSDAPAAGAGSTASAPAP